MARKKKIATLVITTMLFTSISLALPIEIASFISNVNGNNVSLGWSSMTEINNLGFYVERRTSTSQTWIQLGFVPGHGSSTSPSKYSYNDAGLGSGTYFFRLKQVDNNGQFYYYELSNPIVIRANKNEN